MSYLDDIFKNYQPEAKKKSPKQVEKQQDVFENSRRRSAVLENEMALVREVMQDSQIPQRVLNTISVNLSTSSSQQQRKPPTRAEKIQALWDYWKFLDIINFHGGSAAFADCHRELMAWKLRPDALFRQLVLEARGHLKSTLLSVGYVLWRVYQNPNIRMFVGTEGLKLSKAFIREIESYLTDDFNTEHVWNSRPHIDGPLIPVMDSMGKSRRAIVRDISSEFGEEWATDTKKASTSKKVWRAEAIQVVRTRNLKEPTITAGSVGQASTGFHFDEIILDDAHTFDNCSTETKIDKVYSWIYDMESLLDDPYVDIELLQRLHSVAGIHFAKLKRWAISGGRVTVIGTRYDDLDYYGHVIENREALGYETHIKNIYKNGKDSSDGYRWPEKWNEQVEAEKKAQFEKKHGTTGLARFYSQYHNRIVQTEDAVLDWDKIQWINPASVKLEDSGFVSVFHMDGTLRFQFRPRLVVDPTSTATSKSDFCAMAVGGVHNENLVVVDFWMKRAKSEVWLEKMYEFINKWNLHEVVIEMVGGFKILDFAIRQMWLNDSDRYRPISVKNYNPPTNSSEGKIARIESLLSPVLHNSMLHLPLYTSRDQELRKQFILFGKETVKDDGPDVLAILKEMAFKHKQSTNNRKVRLPGKVHPVHGGVVYGDFAGQGGSSYHEVERRLNAG